MFKHFLALEIFFVVLIHFIVSQRISDKKCLEYSNIPAPLNSNIQPHLVWLRQETNTGIQVGDLAILISENFVYTTARIVSHLIVFRSQVYFTPDERYNIVERFIHPDYEISASHSVALLQLETRIVLDSLHRPACLWTSSNYESTNVVDIFEYCVECDGYYVISPQKTINQNDCIQVTKMNNASLFCVKPINAEDNKFIATQGSPVRAYRPDGKYPNNYFVYGIVLFHSTSQFPYISIAIKTSYFLAWIESIVWETQIQACGFVKNINIKPLSTFSTPTQKGEFPWHAAIYRSDKPGERSYICGGSLLNANTVLTAAHCVSQDTGIVSPERLTVSLGRYDLDTTTIDIRESRVYSNIPHTNYSLAYLENDIAILKLNTLIELSTFIQPICIASATDVFPDNIGVVAGWGRNEHGIVEQYLTKASMPIIPEDECRMIDRAVFPLFLYGKNFCAGYQNGTSVCSGDSGGGLFLQRDKQWFIRGVVSFGLSLYNESQCDSLKPALFTDVTKFYDWIVDKL